MELRQVWDEKEGRSYFRKEHSQCKHKIVLAGRGTHSSHSSLLLGYSGTDQLIISFCERAEKKATQREGVLASITRMVTTWMCPDLFADLLGISQCLHKLVPKRSILNIIHIVPWIICSQRWVNKSYFRNDVEKNGLLTLSCSIFISKRNVFRIPSFN